MSVLIWQQVTDDSFEARTADGGRYIAADNRMVGAPDLYGARYRPPQGRARLPKNFEPLGCVKTMAEAKACCERHYRLSRDVS
jgi:hypothetical protein